MQKRVLCTDFLIINLLILISKFLLQVLRSFKYNNTSLPSIIYFLLKLIKKLTINLIETYMRCNPSYSYHPENIPRRVLTIPSEGNLIYKDLYKNILKTYYVKYEKVSIMMDLITLNIIIFFV